MRSKDDETGIEYQRRSEGGMKGQLQVPSSLRKSISGERTCLQNMRATLSWSNVLVSGMRMRR